MEDTLAQNVGGGYNTGLENRGTESGMMDNVTQRASDIVDRYGDREPKRGSRAEHREGPLARAIEQRTAQLPSDTFLWAAVGSMGLSLALELMGEEKKANFVGHWAPTLLIFGLYNKLVKLQGSDGA
jgi:hypothetical protein